MGKPATSNSEPPPAVKRTLPLGSRDPRDTVRWAPESTEHARSLLKEIETVVTSKLETPAEAARIERAWTAWHMGGVTDDAVQQVAHLVDRAYDALHQTPRRKPSRKSSGLAVSSCAQVLYSGLPASVSDRLDFSDVLAVVHELERAIEQWPAVVKATAELLGWNKAALTHAGHAIECALVKKSEPVG